MEKSRQLQRLLLIGLCLLALLIDATSSQQNQQFQQKHNFRENCADEHDKDLLSCTVSAVDCSANVDKLFPPPSGSAAVFPSEAHDLRIEPFAKATPRNRERQHQLLVDISWQTPPNNSTFALKGFLLEVEGEGGRKHACFLLNVSGTEWSAEAVAASPRLHFSADSLFSFAQNYEIELYSLPERSVGTGASVHTRFTTPHNPSGSLAPGQTNPELIAANCSKHSNQFASKWTAGFRHIYVHSAARILQVEFVGAPPQYCFESYEVRLLDETGLELLHSGTVSVEEMQRNGSLLLGQYNFSDLEYDRSYIPSVIPIERAADGRCLCPVFGTDPYDIKVVCSCVAADWRPVRMTRPDVVKLCPGCLLNGSNIMMPPTDYKQAPTDQGKGSVLWLLLLLFNGLFLLLLFLLVAAYVRCRMGAGLPRKDQFRRIRFVPAPADGTKSSGTGGTQKSVMSAGCPPSLAVRTNLTLGTVSASMNTPLIGGEETTMSCSPSLTLLIVYAHDSAPHEQAVLALAEFLRDIFHINVKLDRWDIDQIEHNLTDWLSASVVSADKVLILNSAGAWERYRAKIGSQGHWTVKRTEPDPLDHLFIAHIDMALQHHSVVSARFGHSRGEHTLPMLQGLLQYILPDNICPFVSALFGRNMREDERLSQQALAANEQLAKLHCAVDAMEEMGRERPNWLVETHHRQMESIGYKLDETLVDELVETPEVVPIVEEEELKTKGGGHVCVDVDRVSNTLLADKQAQVNGDKLDSGIFDWAGTTEEDPAGASADGSSNCEEENGVIEEKLEPNACIVPKTGYGEEIAAADSGMVTMDTTSSLEHDENGAQRQNNQVQHVLPALAAN